MSPTPILLDRGGPLWLSRDASGRLDAVCGLASRRRRPERIVPTGVAEQAAQRLGALRERSAATAAFRRFAAGEVFAGPWAYDRRSLPSPRTAATAGDARPGLEARLVARSRPCQALAARACHASMDRRNKSGDDDRGMRSPFLSIPALHCVVAV